MQRTSDSFGGTASLTARRSAASNLPSFELPPPPLAALHNKYQPYSNTYNNNNSSSNIQSNAQSGSVSSIGNLLTPPNSNPSDSLSPTTQHPGSTSQTPLSSFSGSNCWPQQASSQYGYSNSSTQQWMPPPRGLFSPNSLNSLNSIVRSGTTSSSEPSNSSHYEMNQLPPFHSSMSMSSGSLPTMSSSQQMMNTQNTYTGPSSRPPPTPNYFPQTTSNSTSHQSNFSFPAPSQSQTNPPTLGLTQQQVTPANSSECIPTLQQMNSGAQQQYQQRPYGSYPLPLPPMSNSMMPSMPMVGGMNSGMNNNMQNNVMPNYGGLHSIYGNQHQASNTLTDRPFKCDQCIQSFNRNHDLKRHKRIHLAVKPFPCGHCDKSFSRKDALKVSLSTTIPQESS